jgi:hypothetical protein
VAFIRSTIIIHRKINRWCMQVIPRHFIALRSCCPIHQCDLYHELKLRERSHGNTCELLIPIWTQSNNMQPIIRSIIYPLSSQHKQWQCNKPFGSLQCLQRAQTSMLGNLQTSQSHGSNFIS